MWLNPMAGKFFDRFFFTGISAISCRYIKHININNIQDLQERTITTYATLDPNSLRAATHSNFFKKSRILYCRRKQTFAYISYSFSLLICVHDWYSLLMDIYDKFMYIDKINKSDILGSTLNSS